MTTSYETQSKTPIDPVMAAKQLVPLILARRDKAERIRRVPADVATALADAGLLQMYLPRSMGGPELSPLTAFEAIETLSRADGAIGWCAMISSDLSLFMGWLPANVGCQMCGEPADLRVAGSLRPQGRAHVVEGGYRVRGHWNFASGVDHANWLYCPCIVMDGDEPQSTEAGMPRVMSMWIRSDEATIKDTWSAIGMRGTGSNDFIVHDIFVPAARAFSLNGPACERGPLYNSRLQLTAVWAATVANALGIARGAIDSFIELAAETSSTSSSSALRDRPLVQTRVAEAEAILGAARAYVVDSVGSAWAAICDGALDPSHAIAQARLAIVHGMHEAVRSVDLVFHAAGTNAIYSQNPLERYFRDIHVTVQHGAALPAQYESAGKALMGLRPTERGW